MRPIACIHCSTIFTPTASRNKACSVRCRIALGSSFNPESGCIEWQGAIGTHGYGVINVAKVILLVHRLVYEQANGTATAGYHVMHKCDNRRCVTLNHLLLGTPAENSQDMTAKGRHWIKGKPLPEEYRQRLRVPNRKNGWIARRAKS
jgi:hypothetical protein